MGRRVNQPAGVDAETIEEQPSVMGGGLGVEPPVNMKTSITIPGEAAGSAEREPNPEAVQVKVTRYQVMNNADILYSSSRITFKAGKVIDDVAYDVEKLRTMGVRLQVVE